jgi:hypothetical protein
MMDTTADPELLMRWNELLATLPEDRQQGLMNALTLGCGHTAFAVRLLDQDGDSRHALDCLSIAHDALRAARGLLNPAGPQPAVASVRGLATPRPLPRRWRGFVATRSLDQALCMVALMTAAVAHTRAAAEAIMDDGQVDELQWHLIGATAALADARRQVLAAAS